MSQMTVYAFLFFSVIFGMVSCKKSTPGKNILFICPKDDDIFVVTKSLALTVASASKLPATLEMNSSALSISKKWNALAKDPKFQEVAKSGLPVWCDISPKGSYLLYSHGDNTTGLYDIAKDQVSTVELNLPPSLVALSADEAHPMMVQNYQNGLLLTVVLFHDNTLRRNGSVFLCYYASDKRIQRSSTLFNYPCIDTIEWGVIAGFISDDVIYLVGNDSHVHYFDGKCMEKSEACLMTSVEFYSFFVVPDGLSVGQIVAIAVGVFVLAILVVVATFCLIRWKRKRANKKPLSKRLSSASRGGKKKRSKVTRSSRMSKGRRSSLHSRKGASSLAKRSPKGSGHRSAHSVRTAGKASARSVKKSLRGRKSSKLTGKTRRTRITSTHSKRHLSLRRKSSLRPHSKRTPQKH